MKAKNKASINTKTPLTINCSSIKLFFKNSKNKTEATAINQRF
jgi:hypothetical protein